MNNAIETTWEYDNESGRYIVRNARIMYPNFQGAEQNYNAAGKRNFNLLIPFDITDLADDLRNRDIHVRTLEARDDTEDERHLVKISVYQDADIRLLSGKAMTKIRVDNEDPQRDQTEMVDSEFRKGHVINGRIDLEFHLSRNTRVVAASPYLRLDTMIIPIRKSRLLEEYEEFDIDDDFDEPFDE